jgi:PPM family protein phosphatase
LRINYYGNSDKGMVREENQDCFGKFPVDSNDLNNPQGLLFVVADGMGGHAKGKDASNLAVDAIQQIYFGDNTRSIAENIKLAFQTANTKIFNRYLGDQQFQKMGTTASAIILHQNKATIAHVGDSRIYRIYQGKIEQLTSDHTLVAEMQKKGIINKEEAKQHPNKSVLNRAIGIEENVEIDIIKNISLHVGNIFVLCTDGLAKVTAEEIKKVVSESSPEIATSILINMANERGGKDNVTVQVIKLEDEEVIKPANVYEAEKVVNKKWIKYFLIIFSLTALIILGVLFFDDIANIFKSSNEPVTKQEQIFDIDTPKENSDSNSELGLMLAEAERYFNVSDFENSSSTYKAILKDYPMHLSSLNGLYNIAQKYIEKGNNEKRIGKLFEALEYYRKAQQLQPEDKNIENLIASCRSSLIAESNKPKIEEVKEKKIVETKKPVAKPEIKVEEKKTPPVNPKYNLPKNSFWNLEDLLREDFSLNGNDIGFKANSRSKKVVNTYVLKDVVVSVKAIFKNLSSSSAGIIIGYNWNKVTSVEKYFLFTVEPKKRFVLCEVTDGTKKELITIPYDSETMGNTDTYSLSVKYLGAWIMIYNNDKLLKAFYNDSFILGKIGLYADANTDVEFTNFNIAPAVDNLNE